MRITKSSADAARYKGDGTTQDIRYDDKLPGFGLRLFPSGVRSYVVKYRTATGTTRLATIGRHGVLTVEQARVRARRMLVEVGDGKDPLEERRKEKIPTLREAAVEYLEHVRVHNKSWKESARRLGYRYVEEDDETKEPAGFRVNKEHPGYILPALGSKRVTEIRMKDVRDLHTAIARHARIEANRTVALLSALLTYCLPEGVPNPVVIKTPRRKDGITLCEETPRKLRVKREQMPRFAKAIEKEPDVFVRAVVWLALLTACRKSELLQRKWEDIDLDERTVRLADTKSGKEQVVALSEPAVKILRELPRVRGNDYVFPGPWEGSHMTPDTLRKPWKRIRQRAGLMGKNTTTFHDLRKVFASWAIQDGTPIAHISEALRHSSIRVTERAYAHLTIEQPRKALEAHGAQLLKVVQGGKK